VGGAIAGELFPQQALVVRGSSRNRKEGFPRWEPIMVWKGRRNRKERWRDTWNSKQGVDLVAEGQRDRRLCAVVAGTSGAREERPVDAFGG